MNHNLILSWPWSNLPYLETQINFTSRVSDFNIFKILSWWSSPYSSPFYFRGIFLAAQSMNREHIASSSGEWDHQIRMFKTLKPMSIWTILKLSKWLFTKNKNIIYPMLTLFHNQGVLFCPGQLFLRLKLLVINLTK